MTQIFEYYGRYDRLRQTYGRLPSWGRLVVFVFALPGLIGVGLSILALLVSILALLLLCLPVYRLVAALSGSDRPVQRSAEETPPPPSPGRRHVDVTIIE